MNYTKILMSATMITFVVALVFAGTQAFFSDEEASEGNLFTAGALDLKVDSVAHFNGLICEEVSTDVYEWQADGITFATNDDVPPEHYPQPGDPCEGTWEETDLGIEHRFFNFLDLKPGDYGENTISLHVYDNDAWGCFYVENVENNDNGLTEPEEESGDATDGDGEGELGQFLTFDSWLDEGSTPGFQCNHDGATPTVGASCTEDPEEGDNILNGVEVLFWDDESVDEASEGPFNQSDVLSAAYATHSCTEATGNTDYGTCHGLAEDGRMVGSATYYWGLAWNLPVDTGNEIQTDSIVSDMVFTATQHRNNPNFSCPVIDDDDRPLVGAVLNAYVEPELASCEHVVDGVGAGANEYATLQEAVDAAAADETICVDTGTYAADVTVDEDVTILGLNDPKGVDKATIDGQVDIDVDGVVISGLEFTNPDGPFALVIDGVNSTEVSFNSFVDVGTTLAAGGAQAIYYDGAGVATAGLSIHDNMIDGVGNETLVSGGPGGTSAKGIYIGDSTGTAAITGVSIMDNMIMNIDASPLEFASGGRGAYGIHINYGVSGGGSVDGAVVTRNTISGMEGYWARGVGLETDTPSASITRNDISDVVDHLTVTPGDLGNGVFLEGNPGGATTVINENNFAPGVALGVALHPSNPAVAVDAEDNWWGDLDPSDNVDEQAGTIDFDPFESSAFPLN